MTKIQKTDHFYLIDGSGYIFRAYYALPPLTRKSDGLPTGAVSGFCSMLFKLLEDSILLFSIIFLYSCKKFIVESILFKCESIILI